MPESTKQSSEQLIKEPICLISAFLIFIIVTYFIGLSISHHFFLVYFVLSLFVFRKSNASVKYGLPCLLVVLWVIFDAITYVPPRKDMPCGCPELLSHICPHIVPKGTEPATDVAPNGAVLEVPLKTEDNKP